MERIEAAAVRQLFRGCRYTNKHLDRQTTLFIGPYNLSSYSFNVGLIGLDDGGGGELFVYNAQIYRHKKEYKM